MSELKSAIVRLTGNKPLLFDRYLGNEAKLEPIEKAYWSDQLEACLPAINLYSALCAENTKSVTRQFYGRKAKQIGMAINSFLNIKQTELVILQNGKPVHRNNFASTFKVVEHVARLDKGIPNQKVRPMLPLPWTTSYEFDFTPSPDCSWTMLVKIIQQAGTIGLGTYRPMFGTYHVEIQEIT